MKISVLNPTSTTLHHIENAQLILCTPVMICTVRLKGRNNSTITKADHSSQIYWGKNYQQPILKVC